MYGTTGGTYSARVSRPVMLIKLIKSVNFKEAHTENHLMHLTETFAAKLLQIVVSDVSPRQVIAPRILLIELTTIESLSVTSQKIIL